jgi:hypothetical protein
MEYANKVIAYHKEKNAYPSKESPNEEHKKIGSWLFSLRKQYKGIIPKKENFDEICKVLDEYDPDWHLTFTYEIAINNAIRVVKFHKENNAYPIKYSKDNYTKKLGIWLTRCKALKHKKMNNLQTAVKGILYPEVEKILSEDNPEWYK